MCSYFYSSELLQLIRSISSIVSANNPIEILRILWIPLAPEIKQRLWTSLGYVQDEHMKRDLRRSIRHSIQEKTNFRKCLGPRLTRFHFPFHQETSDGLHYCPYVTLGNSICLWVVHGCLFSIPNVSHIFRTSRPSKFCS